MLMELHNVILVVIDLLIHISLAGKQRFDALAVVGWLANRK